MLLVFVIYLTITTMVWSKKNKDSLTNTTNPVGGGIRSNKRLTHTKQLNLLTILKNLSLTTLTTSLLLVLTINIYRTYSYTNTLTNAAESSNPSIQANTDPNIISISISDATGPDPDSGNITITTPTGGGIATGKHTLTIYTSSIVTGLSVTLQGNGGETALVPNDFGYDETTNPNSNNNYIHPVTDSTANQPAPLDKPVTLSNNQWGIALPDSTLYQGKYFEEKDYDSANQSTLANTTYAAIPSKGNDNDLIAQLDHPANPEDGAQFTIYYGVKVSPTIQAGTYSAEVTYTATAILPPLPTLTRLIINDSIPANQTSEFAIEGTNLDTVSSIKLCLRDQQQTSTTNCYEATDINTYLDDATSTRGTVLSFTNPEIEQPGIYDLYAISPVGEVKLEQPFYVQEESICRSGDPNSDCIVDKDANMIPIYYDGNTENGEAIWKVAKPNDSNNPGSWYDYTNKKWANAVTVTKAALDANKYQNPGTTIDNNDVLGYWVYIPRYAYEVQRPNAVDRVVADEYPLPDNKVTNDHNSHSIRNNFSIHFETDKDTKKTPASSCNLGIKTAGDMWNDGTPNIFSGPDNTNIKAKDYRTTCVNESNGTITRDYHDTLAKDIPEDNTTTWATHPAFTWSDGTEAGTTELNGIWVGKFETTGTITNPTVKPNQHANISERTGNFYTMAKHIGIYDENNTGGNDVTGNGTTLNAQGEWTSLHNLKTTTSHMFKNSEWGAVAYLASSIYGAGTNNVSINSAFPITSADADISTPSSRFGYGITGCGPKDINRSVGYYNSVATSTGETIDLPALSSSHIEDPLACGDTAHSYIGNIGVLASTTNNVYGIYDMSGGANEYVMGNLSDSPNETSNLNFSNPTKPPYVDIYLSTDFSLSNKPDYWSASDSIDVYPNDLCTWSDCGGHALHETKLYQTVSGPTQSWDNDYSYFANSDDRWFLRGGDADSGSTAGLFNSDNFTGYFYYNNGFRAVLSP